jgi:hypothetical protein
MYRRIEDDRTLSSNSLELQESNRRRRRRQRRAKAALGEGGAGATAAAALGDLLTTSSRSSGEREARRPHPAARSCSCWRPPPTPRRSERHEQRSQQSWLPTNNPGLVVSCRVGLRGPPAPPPVQEQEGRRQVVAAETAVDAMARR